MPIAHISLRTGKAEVDLTPPRDAMLVTPPPAAMERLQRLHRAAGIWRRKRRRFLSIQTPRGGWSRR